MAKASEEVYKHTQLAYIYSEASKVIQSALTSETYTTKHVEAFQKDVPKFVEIHQLSDDDVFKINKACDEACNYLQRKKDGLAPEEQMEKLKGKLEDLKGDIDKKKDEHLEEVEANKVKTVRWAESVKGEGAMSINDAKVMAEVEKNLKETSSFLESVKVKWQGSKIKSFFESIGEWIGKQLEELGAIKKQNLAQTEGDSKKMPGSEPGQKW